MGKVMKVSGSWMSVEMPGSNHLGLTDLPSTRRRVHIDNVRGVFPKGMRRCSPDRMIKEVTTSAS
jgi:hypothetical protein